MAQDCDGPFFPIPLKTRFGAVGLRLLHQPGLRGDCGRAIARGAEIAAVGLEKACFGVVAEVGAENLAAEASGQGGIEYREHDLAAFEEVAGHPVGAAAEDLGMACVAKAEDAAVFQKAADDGADADAIAEALDARAESAHAADDQ